MPDRDSASYCRPRLYDKNDPEARDDVGLVLESIDDLMEEAMDEGDKETVEHASDLKRRLLRYADDDYKERFDEEPASGAEA